MDEPWSCLCRIRHPSFVRRCYVCGGISPAAAELCARIAEDQRRRLAESLSSGLSEPVLLWLVEEWTPVPHEALRLRSERARLLREEGIDVG